MKISDFIIYEELIEAQPMVFARRVGAYGPENGALMEKFKKWALDNGYMTDDAVILGIARDDVNTTPPDACRYDVCLLGEYDVNEKWIEQGDIDSGKYVVMEMPHTAEAVTLAWQEAIPYLIEMGYQLDFTRPIIERYRKSLVDKRRCEMLLPIK